MSQTTTITYNCDYCGRKLPDDYATTDGKGKSYYVKKAHDVIPLDTPISGCTGIVVEVTMGRPNDDHHFSDLCNKCRLKFLKMAVDYLEGIVDSDDENDDTESGGENEGQETDV